MDVFELVSNVAAAIPIVSSIFKSPESVLATANAIAAQSNDVGISGSFDFKMPAGLAVLLLFMPIWTTAFTRVIAMICRLMVWANHKCVDNIPVPWIRELFERYQIGLLQSAVYQFEATIKKIKGKGPKL